MKKTEIRCAIYTRKSTEEGLDQEFNSLDAQRESGEAYITSQLHEGWVCLPTRYDDGGFTGGNMERPALARLMADIEASKIDCVVCYKVDRLSRSLLDFARMMETFEKHRVSFVSVTQRFDTGTSMGRLILNVLLSFAQFEREIISERTRDKIAASKRKGKWLGGRPILGYDFVPPSKLVVNEDEARRVVAIFELYLRHESLLRTLQEVKRRQWYCKTWISKRGNEIGGKPFTKDQLYRLLTNVMYVGMISHHGQHYKGEHPGIVPEELFNNVQIVMQRNKRTGGALVRNKFGALLKGLLRCKSCSYGMTTSYSLKKKTRYRYYVCVRAQKQGWSSCPTKSVPAAEIEKSVIDQIRCIGNDPALLAETVRLTQKQATDRIAELETEERFLQRDLQRHHKELKKLLPLNGNATGLADLQQRLEHIEKRQTEVREEKIAISRGMISAQEVAAAFRAFEPAWEAMTPYEQARLLRLLVRQVDYDGAAGEISIEFQPCGIKALATEGGQQ